MFRHILVPLDGTIESEQALPMAARIARATGAMITLVRIAKLPTEYFPFPYSVPLLTDESFQVNETDAKEYLEQRSAISVLSSLHVNIQVITALSTAAVLAEDSSTEKVDLIVMSSHGYTGLKRFILGSIAQQVARRCAMPMLVLHAHDASVSDESGLAGQFPVVVSLDGSLRAEQALVPAAELSVALSAPQPGKLHLLRVVQSISAITVRTEQAVKKANDTAVEAADAYLKAIEEKLRQGELINVPLQVSSEVCSADDIHDALITTAEHEIGSHTNAGALALTTHGRSGINRWLSGSVTEDIMGHTRLPLFILRRPMVAKGEQSGAKDAQVLSR
jgi:nucleotide-binding universal stress UspA family protein